MPLSPGDLAPNIVLQELCNGQHPFRQINQRPKLHLWEHFANKPRILVIFRQWSEFAESEALVDFINSHFEIFFENAYVLLAINANFAAAMYGRYQAKNHPLPLYAIQTSDLRMYNQLGTMGTTPYTGVYLISSESKEPKVLDYLPLEFGEEYYQKILDLIENLTPAIPVAVSTPTPATNTIATVVEE